MAKEYEGSKEVVVSGIEADQGFVGFFIVSDLQQREGKKNNTYWSLKLGDRTGKIDARIWDPAPPEFKNGDIVKVDGQSSEYNGSIQVKISRSRKCSDEDVDLGDFFPKSKIPREQIQESLKNICQTMSKQLLREVCLEVVDGRLSDQFYLAPAAVGLHHAYLQGLSEHVLSICRLVNDVCHRYENLDRDILIASAIFHDVGKIDELSYERDFSYSVEGTLIGHISMGSEIFDECCRNLGASSRLEPFLLVKHIILSHHGQLAWGSPKVPTTPEAVAFHYLDVLDAKMNALSSMEPGEDGFAPWTKVIEARPYLAGTMVPVKKKGQGDLFGEER